MKNLITIVFAVFLIIPPATSQDTCSLFKTMFEEETLNNFIKSFDRNYNIRITDTSGFYGTETIWCGYNRYGIRVQNKLMVDLNTRRYIDIIITSFKVNNEELIIKLFFAKRRIDCKEDELMEGEMVFMIEKNEFTLKSCDFVLSD